jgi:hypothetical protein
MNFGYGDGGGRPMSPRLDVEELLDDRSYDIEFNGHLTNHAKHAVIALGGLGASPERIRAYYDAYAKLTPYGYGLEPPRHARHAVSEANWTQLLGKRTSFWAYCQFFDRQERELGLDELLRRYVPRLLPGWVGSLTHAAIHLGWALDAGSRWMTIEGLAYMAFSYVSCHPERARPAGGPTEQPVDTLLRVACEWERDHDALRDHIEALIADTSADAAAAIHPELARSGLQYRIARVLAEGHPLIYATPAWIDGQDAGDSWEQLYYAVTLLYLAEPGDFLLLHLLTSLHAVEQIADRLPAEQRTYAVKCFWMAMLCLLFSRAQFPARPTLAALHARYADARDPRADWDEIIARAIAQDEEHNPKMVYVLRRAWQRSHGRAVYRAAAAHFVTTPELPKSFDDPPAE